MAQAEHIRDNHAARAEAPLAPFMFYLPRCTQHAGIYADDTFQAFEIGAGDAELPYEAMPYGEAIAGFIEDVSAGTERRLVIADDGGGDGDGSNCP